MQNRESSGKKLPPLDFKQWLFNATGLSFRTLGLGVTFLAIAVVGIFSTVLYTNARQVSEVSGIENVQLEKMTAKEMFFELTKLPPYFPSLQAVEKIGILRSKIRVGEELMQSQDRMKAQALAPLVKYYGVICFLQEEQGIDPGKDYVQFANYRDQAAASGEKRSVASADFYRVLAATQRLYRRTKQADFRFAEDAVARLNSDNIVDVKQMNLLYATATKLHDTSSNPQSTAELLSLLGDKISRCTKPEVSSIGLNLKDHVRFARFHAAVQGKPYTTRESKLQFFREMFEEIERDPPQSPRIYHTALVLIDRLLNKSEGFFAGTLVTRIRKASLNVAPQFRPIVDRAIDNLVTRLEKIGETVELSGADLKGAPLRLPNANPTELLFYKPSDVKSMKYVKSFAESNLFNPWDTNILVACNSQQSVEELKKTAEALGTFTILDNETASRFTKTFAIDLIPYQVSFDKDGKVIRLGSPTD